MSKLNKSFHDRTSLRSTESISGDSFQIHFSPKHYRYHHKISIVDAETSSKDNYGLKYEYFYSMWQLLIALLESIF